MNIAEIRKKAVATRRTDDADLHSHAELVNIDADLVPDHVGRIEPDEFAFAELASVSEPATEIISAVDELRLAGENGIEPMAAVKDVSMPAVATPEGGQALAVTDVGSSLPEPVAAVSTPPLKHVTYDPLTVLLEGRRSAAGEDDLGVADSQEFESNQVQEYLCFKVADEEYALSIMAIKEIIKPREVTEVPRMPKFISGVISLRGVIIPVMDMRLRLSLPVGVPTGRERVLVLRTSSGLCGVLVDEVVQVVKIHDAAIEGPPAVLDGIDREFVKGLGRYDKRMLILLNLESILDLAIH